MLVIRDLVAIDDVIDPELRLLIRRSAEQLLVQFEPGEYSLEELCFYIVVEPGDTGADAIAAIDELLGRSILETKPELILDHPNYVEVVVVLSDDGYGATLFLPKQGLADDLSGMLSHYCREEHK